MVVMRPSREISALLYIGFWFVTQFFSGIGSLGIQTAETGGVAYWAHIGGFIAGMALAFIFKIFPPQPGQSTKTSLTPGTG